MPPSPAKMVADVFRNDLCAFIHRSFIELNPKSTLLHNWHHEVLAQKLEEVLSGTCRRLIINLPPRQLKSHSASIAFPAWALGRKPSLQILCVSYAQEFSDNLARASRTLMMSPFYKGLFDTRISDTRNTVSDFYTTKEGRRFSTSVGGALTGFGADLIIIDDALKADDALSDARRNSVNQWYDNTLRSRLNNQKTGAIVIVMQRLHMDDLVAHVQETEHWEVLSFPAIAEDKKTYRVSTHYGRAVFTRKPDEVLHPAFQPHVVLETLRRSMTDYNFAAQYQQNPQPAQGLIVKRDWLKFYSAQEKPETFDLILDSWDTAVKDTELSNFSVCTSWGVKSGKAYLLDVYRKKLEFPDLKKAVQKLAEAHRTTVVLVEDKASGSSLIQDLRAEGFSLIQAAPSLEGDKIMRLRGQTGKIEGGFALFPKKAAWLETYLSELLTFPNAKYDDQVDSTVLALAWIWENPRWAGTLIKPSWLRYYTALPADQRNKRVFISWDIAAGDAPQNDWSVGTTWARIEGIHYLLDMVRGIYDYPELRQKVIELRKPHERAQVLIEDTPIGQALKEDPEIRKHPFSIKLVPIEQNRKSRVYAQQDVFKSGRVQFPKDASFMREVENQLLSYPHGQTDDIVDSISQALNIGTYGYDTTLSWL